VAHILSLGIADIGTAYSGISADLATGCSEATMIDEDHSDWLHSNLEGIPDVIVANELQDMTGPEGGHGQISFIEKSQYSDKKRQRDSSDQKRQRQRERYSSMTDEQKYRCLQNIREYKKKVRGQKSPFITPSSTPVVQTQASKINPAGIVCPRYIVLNMFRSHISL
jgi:hypothetical protein